MNKSVFKFYVVSFLFAWVVPVQATIVQGEFHGLIAEFAETSGEGSSVFGLDGAGLLGQPFRVDFSYDTERAPKIFDFQSDPESSSTYQSNDLNIDWLDMSITVNSMTHFIEGNFRYADITDSVSSHPNNTSNPDAVDRLQLALQDNLRASDFLNFRREFLDIAVSLPTDALDSGELPTSVFSDDITRVFNSATFRLDEVDRDLITGDVLFERFVGFNLDVQSINATAVSSPPTIILFMISLLFMLLVWRKQNI